MKQGSSYTANPRLVEAAYALWLKNPESVDASWRYFFDGYELGSTQTTLVRRKETPPKTTESETRATIRVHRLINAYRAHGHLQAHLDPLSPAPEPIERLHHSNFDFADAELDKPPAAATPITLSIDRPTNTLRQLIEALRQTYTSHIGVEYMHVQDIEARRWLQARMEATLNRPAFSKTTKSRILRRLVQAETLERFLNTKFPGQKRFSLEGGESMIPALDSAIQLCPSLGIEEIAMGMAHRGRLNVLAVTLEKPLVSLFNAFTDAHKPNHPEEDGDVKYHLGYETTVTTQAGEKVEIRLAANPSHLEVVNPVVEGKARARQRLRNDTERRHVLPLLIHGDAAIAGQGIVAETLNFSQLRGYTTGGTLHFVINNQIGFTTAPSDARSTRYCTDFAKIIEAPIFHVNGDDPEAVAYVARLALEFRARFKRDVFVDMYCYRRYGHNELDEPSFTQPLLYRQIASHPPVSELYKTQLEDEGVIAKGDAQTVVSEITEKLEFALARAKAETSAPVSKQALREAAMEGFSTTYQPRYDHNPVATGVALPVLDKITSTLTDIPEGFRPNPKIIRILNARSESFAKGGPIDWAHGEALAFGSLILEGIPVRLSGQDSIRGTFSHRHARLYDSEDGSAYTPLDNLTPPDTKSFCVYNSLLSEASVLGFDYGYSLEYPKALILWEAQFGDFANGAQVVIDQFIAAAESKWQRPSGIVLLLPHGYEGQGPDHSSARLERYLQLCAGENIQVANITTPANYFHVLRRQMHRPFLKPLIIMTPKSLLRHPSAVSPLSEFTQGSFREIIPDENGPAHSATRRIIFCTGKVYYDLAQYREENAINDTAIVRIEQLYPLNRESLADLAAACPDAKLVWCQEEPHNMGAYRFIAPRLEKIFKRVPTYCGRKPAASPATGFLSIHKQEQSALVSHAFKL